MVAKQFSTAEGENMIRKVIAIALVAILVGGGVGILISLNDEDGVSSGNAVSPKTLSLTFKITSYTFSPVINANYSGNSVSLDFSAENSYHQLYKVSYKVEVYWGDSSQSESAYSQSGARYQSAYFNHEYRNPGNYEISVSVRIYSSTTSFEKSGTINVTIDPKKYSVVFKSNGGTQIPSQTINEGEVLLKPGNPTKGNYVFYRWLLNNKEYDFSKAVTQDLTLTAEWYDKLIFTSKPGVST